MDILEVEILIIFGKGSVETSSELLVLAKDIQCICHRMGLMIGNFGSVALKHLIGSKSLQPSIYQ